MTVLFSSLGIARLTNGLPQLFGDYDGGPLYTTWPRRAGGPFLPWSFFALAQGMPIVITAATLPDGRPQVFFIQGTNLASIEKTTENPSAPWTDWTPFKPGQTGEVTQIAASSVPGVGVALFAVQAGTSQIISCWTDPTASDGYTGWSQFQSSAATQIGSVTFDAAGTSTVQLFAVTASGDVLTCWRTAAHNWNNWSNFTSSTTPWRASYVAATPLSSGNTWLFAITTSGALMSCWRKPSSGWSAWSTFLAPPGAVQLAVTQLPGGGLAQIFLVDSNGALHSCAESPGSPGGWTAWGSGPPSDSASTGTDVYCDDVPQAFGRVSAGSPVKFQIHESTAGPTVPSGANASGKHQQGIQKLANGSLLVSGSADGGGYFYLSTAIADTVSNIVTVVVPQSADFPGNPPFKSPQGHPYDHLGGCQVSRPYLAVGNENLDDESESTGTSAVLVYSLGPQTPKPCLSFARSQPGQSDTAGAVGLAKLPSGAGWLLAVGNYNSVRLDFYTCNSPDLSAPGATFGVPFASYSSSSQGFTNQVIAGTLYTSVDNKWGDYQNVNLFLQSDGSIWFIGMHRDAWGDDYADLYVVSFTSGAPATASVTKVANLHFTCTSGISMQYGSGFYFDATTMKFEVYACEQNLNKGSRTVLGFARCDAFFTP